jgi:hypothetical protein
MMPLVNELSKMKEDLELLQPDDRMSLLVAISRAVNAIAMSAGGWQQFLSDATTLEKFDKAVLTSFYDYFRQEAIKQLEFDVKVLTEYASIIGASLHPQGTQRPRGAYA